MKENTISIINAIIIISLMVIILVFNYNTTTEYVDYKVIHRFYFRIFCALIIHFIVNFIAIILLALTGKVNKAYQFFFNLLLIPAIEVFLLMYSLIKFW